MVDRAFDNYSDVGSSIYSFSPGPAGSVATIVYWRYFSNIEDKC